MTATILDFQKGQRVLRPLTVYRNSQARLRDLWAVKQPPPQGGFKMILPRSAA